MIINPSTQTPFWYYSTTEEKAREILANGLACQNTMAGHCVVPWTFVSPTPDLNTCNLIVDLSGVEEDKVSWSSYPDLLRIHVPIPANMIVPFEDLTRKF